MFWAAANKKVEPPKVAVKPVWIRVYLVNGNEVRVKANSSRIHQDRMLDFYINDACVASFQGSSWLYHKTFEETENAAPAPLNSDSQ